MFVTLPAFESPMPPFLMEPGGRSWRAVELSVRLPWYIVTVIRRDEEASCKTDLLLCCEADLIGLVSERTDEVSAIQYVEPPSYNLESRWRTRSIRRVWLGHGRQSTGVIFEDESGEFCGRTVGSEPVQLPRRTLLADLTEHGR